MGEAGVKEAEGALEGGEYKDSKQRRPVVLFAEDDVLQADETLSIREWTRSRDRGGGRMRDRSYTRVRVL